MPFNDELKFEAALIDLLTTSCGWEKEIIKNPTEEEFCLTIIKKRIFLITVL